MNKKSIYVPKPITPELACQNVKFLHILVFKCEADWAYAMQMKQVATNLQSKTQQPSLIKALEGSRTNANRLRVHCLKRFKAAAKTAHQIQNNCSSAFNEQSLFELEAYVCFIQAVYLMESHRYEDAMDNLLKSQIIYKQIAEYRDPMEALIYSEKVS